MIGKGRKLKKKFFYDIMSISGLELFIAKLLIFKILFISCMLVNAQLFNIIFYK